MGSFDGQVAWITGGGSGLGASCAHELARQGAKVAVSGRRVDRLESVAAAIRAAGGQAIAVPCDVSEDEDVAAAVAAVVAEWGQLDVLLANAGFGVAGRFDKLTVVDWQRQFDVNVFGLLRTVYAAMPHLQETGGRIGLVGSVMAYLTLPANGAYAASKHAVRIIGETLAAELRGSGVSCTTLHPGFVATEIGQVDNRGHHDASRKDPRPAALMWTADDAARVMVRALHRRKRQYVFTGHGRFAVFMARHLPNLVFLATRGKPRRTRAEPVAPTA